MIPLIVQEHGFFYGSIILVDLLGISIHMYTCLPLKAQHFFFLFNYNPLPDDKILDWSKFKQIADTILKCNYNGK